MDKNLKLKHSSYSQDKKPTEVITIDSNGETKQKTSTTEECISDKKENEDNAEEKQENEIIFKIIKKIGSIIKYSKERNIFFLYFTNEFWKEILNYNSKPNIDKIYICSELRKAFNEYNELVMNIFKDKKQFTIKNEANSYYDRDEFAFRLDQEIREYINRNKTLQNIEKLQTIKVYNPYYNEEKYYIKDSKVDAEIFNLFDLNNIDNEFIDDFRNMNFEEIFKENIVEYINKITSKIKSISDFEIILRLINIDNISEKNIYLDALNKKYNSIIKPKIESLNGENLTEAIQIVAKLAIINYMYETEDKKKFNFIEKKIKRLDKSIIPNIFIEIIKICIEKSKENNENKKNEEEEEERENDDQNENDKKKQLEEQKEIDEKKN